MVYKKSYAKKSNAKAYTKKVVDTSKISKIDPQVILDRFTTEQKNVVDRFVNNNGKASHLFVNAVPGSGKSTVGVNAGYWLSKSLLTATTLFSPGCL